MIRSTSQLYADALGDIKAKRFREAIKKFGKVVDQNPDDAMTYQGLAECFFELKRYEDALIASNKAIEINPSLAIAHEIRGFVYGQRSRYDEAEAELRKAISLDGKLSGAWIFLGMALYSKQEYSAAEDSLNAAIRLDPLSKAAYYYLAVCQFLQRKFDSALQSALTGFRRSPSLFTAEMILFIIDTKYNGAPTILFTFVYLYIAGTSPILALPIGLAAVAFMLHIAMFSMRNKATKQVFSALFLAVLYVVGYVYTVLSFRK